MTTTQLQKFYSACDSGDIKRLKLSASCLNKLILNQSHGLHLTCRNGYYDCTKYLMDKVDLNQVVDGKLPIDEAARKGYLDIVKLLFPKSKTDQLLKYAIQGNSVATIQYVSERCELTDYDTLFKDIRSLEAFQVIMLQIVNVSKVNEMSKRFLKSGIEYQFKKIKNSIAISKSNSLKISTTKSPPSNTMHVTKIPLASVYVDELSPTPSVFAIAGNLPRNRSSSLTSSSTASTSTTKSILKSPSGTGNTAIKTEEISAGLLSPTAHSAPYSLI
eukprot:NODE_669_length_5359_cov_0.427376.p1 type:complete len:274 gc:universal NODE_669_length_5359_cov_0.427376:3714-2893(-)